MVIIKMQCGGLSRGEYRRCTMDVHTDYFCRPHGELYMIGEYGYEYDYGYLGVHYVSSHDGTTLGIKTPDNNWYVVDGLDWGMVDIAVPVAHGTDALHIIPYTGTYSTRDWVFECTANGVVRMISHSYVVSVERSQSLLVVTAHVPTQCSDLPLDTLLYKAEIEQVHFNEYVRGLPHLQELRRLKHVFHPDPRVGGIMLDSVPFLPTSIRSLVVVYTNNGINWDKFTDLRDLTIISDTPLYDTNMPVLPPNVRTLCIKGVSMLSSTLLGLHYLRELTIDKGTVPPELLMQLTSVCISTLLNHRYKISGHK